MYVNVQLPHEADGEKSNLLGYSKMIRALLKILQVLIMYLG